MRKALLIIFTFLGLVAIFVRFGSEPLVQFMGLTPQAGLRIESTPKTKVLLNGEEAGTTPFQDEDLESGEYFVKLETEEASDSGKMSWQGYVKLNAGTLTVVNRELTGSQAKSSGEVINLEKGAGVTVVSIPQGAEVSIDGKSVGRTPVSINSIDSGEHQFLVGKDNFLKRSIRATLVDNYNLTLSVDLAVAEPDLTKLSTVPIESTGMVTVKKTPTGFLNVRATASSVGQIIAKVNPGDSLTLLEEVPNWNKIRTADGKEGYVSSSYVEKKTQ